MSVRKGSFVLLCADRQSMGSTGRSLVGQLLSLNTESQATKNEEMFKLVYAGGLCRCWGNWWLS